MKKLFATLLALPLAALPFTASAASQEEAPTAPCIVSLTEGTSLELGKSLVDEKLGLTEDQFVYDYMALNMLWIDVTPAECQELKDLPIDGISGAVEAATVSISPDPLRDPELAPTWPFNPAPDGMGGQTLSTVQQVPTGYRRVDAEPLPESALDPVTGGANVDVAVIDTGVDQFHEDLHVVGGFDCTDPQNGEDNWGHDGYGHGTHVAGIIGAKDNDRGVIGIAAGARIWSFKVLGDDGSGSFASVLCGIDQVAQQANTIEFANLSLGGFSPPTPLWGTDPIHNGFGIAAKLGVVIVVSAGNDGIDSVNSSPANFAESVVTVSALTDYDGMGGSLAAPPDQIPTTYLDDHRALFSNYGPMVDFIAPGVDILSTTPLNTYGRASGTSMASPEVTGTLAAAEASGVPRKYVVQAVLDWSAQPGWRVRSGWDGDIGLDHEPLVRFGAPIPTEKQIAEWEEAS